MSCMTYNPALAAASICTVMGVPPRPPSRTSLPPLPTPTQPPPPSYLVSFARVLVRRKRLYSTDSCETSVSLGQATGQIEWNPAWIYGTPQPETSSHVSFAIEDAILRKPTDTAVLPVPQSEAAAGPVMAPRPIKPDSYDFGVPTVTIADPVPAIDDIPEIPDEDIMSSSPPVMLDGRVNPMLWAPSEIEMDRMPPLLPVNTASRTSARRASQAEMDKSLVSTYISRRRPRRPSALGPTPLPTIPEHNEWPSICAFPMARSLKHKRRVPRGRPKMRRVNENRTVEFVNLVREERAAAPKHGRARVASLSPLTGSPLH